MELSFYVCSVFILYYLEDQVSSYLVLFKTSYQVVSFSCFTRKTNKNKSDLKVPLIFSNLFHIPSVNCGLSLRLNICNGMRSV